LNIQIVGIKYNKKECHSPYCASLLSILLEFGAWNFSPRPELNNKEFEKFQS